MAISVPLINGRTKQVFLRADQRSYSFKRILTLIREEVRITPKQLRKEADNNVGISDYRSIAVYLAHYYPGLSVQEIADYFGMQYLAVKEIIEHPSENCRLEALAYLQNIIEKTLNFSIPVNLRTGKILTIDDLSNIWESGQGEDCEHFVASTVGSSSII